MTIRLAHRTRHSDMMLSNNMTAVYPFEKGSDELVGFEKCQHHAREMQEFNHMMLGMNTENYHMHPGSHMVKVGVASLPHVRTDSLQQKKAKPPIETHEFYIALTVDPLTGKIRERSSPSLRQHRSEILKEAGSKLSHLMNSRFADFQLRKSHMRCLMSPCTDSGSGGQSKYGGQRSRHT